jgi:hypothetical protein
LRAQWTYTEWRFTVYSVTQIKTQISPGHDLDMCYVQYALAKTDATKKAALPYPTRELCESTRQEVISQYTSCVSVVCGPCTSNSFSFGPPSGGSEGGFPNEIGNTNITGTNQGDPFYTQNPYDALQDAYDQKNYQNEVLLGNDDTKFTNFTGGRPASAEGIFNWAKQRRPLSSNDVRKSRAGGRPGSVGGFTGRPTGASAANRYNGQMGSVLTTNPQVKGKNLSNLSNMGLGKKPVDVSTVGNTPDQSLTIINNVDPRSMPEAKGLRQQLEQNIKEKMPTPTEQLEGINTDIKDIEDMVQEKIKTLEAGEAAELQTTLDNIIEKHEPSQPQQPNEQPQTQQTDEQPCDAACDQAKIEKRSAMLKELQGAFPDIAERLKRKKQQQQQRTGGKK